MSTPTQHSSPAGASEREQSEGLVLRGAAWSAPRLPVASSTPALAASRAVGYRGGVIVAERIAATGRRSWSFGPLVYHGQGGAGRPAMKSTPYPARSVMLRLTLSTGSFRTIGDPGGRLIVAGVGTPTVTMTVVPELGHGPLVLSGSLWFGLHGVTSGASLTMLAAPAELLGVDEAVIFP